MDKEKKLTSSIERQKFQMTQKGLKEIADAIKTKDQIVVKELGGEDTIVLKAKKGDKGDPGHTPTNEELVAIIKPLIPEPKNGVDGKTPSDQELLKLIKPYIPVAQDGETPSDDRLLGLIRPLIPEVKVDEESIAKKASKMVVAEVKNTIKEPDTIEEIIKKLQGVKKQWVNIEQIKGDFNSKVSRVLIGGGSSMTENRVREIIAETPVGPTTFVSLTDVPQTYSGSAGKAAVVNGTEDGLVFTTISGTDEKVKYNTSDAAAGYLADKIVAGSGISLAEGTGGDADKLVITNSNATPYSLPTAAAGTLGGIKIGSRLSIDGSGVLSADAQSGSGDVTGPASAVDSNFASFNTTTGKLIKDSGHKHSDYAPALGADDNYVTDAQLVVIGNTSGTNSGDNATNSQYSGLAASKLDASAFTDTAVTGKLITNFVSGAGSVAATDTLLQAINKLDGNVALKAPLTAPTFATSITGSYLTASELLGTGASKEIVSLPVATYPSLTELSYIKGLTSAIQTQLNGKQASMGADDNYVTDAEKIVIGNTSGTNSGDNATNSQYSGLAASKADVAQTFYIGTTQIVINRASAALTLAGLTLTTPDIGTPSAGVLTNATGLPIAGLVASTSTAIGVGSIELGHATDTTIARVSAGVVSIEGSNIMTVASTDTVTGVKTYNSFIAANNAIAASGNAATVPITYSLSTVTNNSAATLTITMTTTSAVDGQRTTVRILDFSAAAQTVAWVNTENSTVAAPLLSNGSTTLPVTVQFVYNGGTSKWRCIGVV